MDGDYPSRMKINGWGRNDIEGWMNENRNRDVLSPESTSNGWTRFDFNWKRGLGVSGCRQRQAVPGESCAPKAHHAAGPGWAMPTLPVALGSFGAKRGGQGSVRSLANFQLHRHGQPLPILLNAILFLAPPSQALSALPTTPPPFDRCLPPSRVYILFSSGNITRIFSGSSASVSSTCEFEDIFSVLRPSEIASCRSSLCLSMPWLVFCSPFEASPWFLIIPWLIDGSWMVHGCLVVEALGSSWTLEPLFLVLLRSAPGGDLEVLAGCLLLRSGYVLICIPLCAFSSHVYTSQLWCSLCLILTQCFVIVRFDVVCGCLKFLDVEIWRSIWTGCT